MDMVEPAGGWDNRCAWHEVGPGRFTLHGPDARGRIALGHVRRQKDGGWSGFTPDGACVAERLATRPDAQFEVERATRSEIAAAVATPES